MAKKFVRLDHQTPSARMFEWEKSFRQHVIAQDRAVKSVVKDLCLAEAGLSPQRKPKSVFVFAGPTGVGKTHMVEVLAKLFFGEFDAYTYIDCNMFSERHEVSRLVGSPPGYVGFKDDVALLSQQKIDSFGFNQSIPPSVKEQLEEIRKQIKKIGQPKSMEEAHRLQQLMQIEEQFLARNYQPGSYKAIILFDEIEKAHRSFFTHLFDIVDKARLSMGDGTVTNFRNAYIFMTSNVGAEKIKNILAGKGRLGFIHEEFKDISELIYRTTLEEMQNFFREIPELLGRIGKENIIVFNELQRKDMAGILEMRLKEVKEALGAYNLQLYFTRQLKDFILDEASDPFNKILGARPLQRLVKRFVLEPLSMLLMKGSQEGGIGEGDKVVLTVKDKKVVILKQELSIADPPAVKPIVAGGDDESPSDIPVRNLPVPCNDGPDRKEGP